MHPLAQVLHVAQALGKEQHVEVSQGRRGRPVRVDVPLVEPAADLVEGGRGRSAALEGRNRQVGQPPQGFTDPLAFFGLDRVEPVAAQIGRRGDHQQHAQGAQGRGGGLFSLLAGQSSPAIVAAGSIWALWDLAAHLSDPELAAVCLAVAQDLLPDAQLGRSTVERPLRLALMVAAHDVQQQRIPIRGFGPRHYVRLLLASLTR